MTYRKPISRLGAQDARVVLDEDFILSAQENGRETYYPIAAHYSDNTILERQVLVSRINNGSEEDHVVLGNANGMGGSLLERFDVGDIPADLARACIMAEFRAAGVSVSQYNAGSGNQDGFVATFAGTTTIPATVDIKAGQRLVVDVPTLERNGGGGNRATSGPIPLIVRPVDDELPGHRLKQAIHATIWNSEAWDELARKNLPVSTWHSAAANVTDSNITAGLAMIKVLIEAGVLQPALDKRSDAEFRSAGVIRNQYITLLNNLYPNLNRADIIADDRTSKTSRDLAVESDAICTVLYKMLMGPFLQGSEASREYNSVPAAVKSDLKMLRKGIVLATCQDAESSKITSHASVIGSDGNLFRLGTAFGYVTESGSNGSVFNVRDSTSRSGSDLYSNYGAANRSALAELCNSQYNHLTKTVSSFSEIMHSEREIGVALNSSSVGGTIDVRLNVK